jgi:dolichol-phosphate mannosyltransferase
MNANKEVTFSFIVPVYNEQDGVERFYSRLFAVAQKLGEPYEVIFINDGSTDDTAGVLHRLALADDHVRVVEFSRNYGHQAALTAGYDFAGGRAVVSLDGDGQHPPELIPDLVARWRDGFEIVYTIRKDTRGISFCRRGFIHLAYRLIAWTTKQDLTDQADFRLMDRKAVDALRSHREKARFLRGLVRHIGFRQTSVEYVAEKRIAGKSVYSFSQSFRLMMAGVFNFSLMPLRLPLVIGAAMLTATVLYAVAALLLWPFGLAPSPWWHLAAGLVLLFGLQFLMLGVMGEYIGRTFQQVKDRPLYIVRHKFGFDREESPMRPGKTSRVTDRFGGMSVFT